MGHERVVVAQETGSLKAMTLMSVNSARFCVAEAQNPVLVLARVVGFDDAVFGLTETQTYPLVNCPSDHVYISTACLSDFSKLRLMPENRWQAFWESVMSNLTGQDVRFAKWPARVWPAYGEQQQMPDTARIHAVRKGVEWFWNGHFLIHPSWKEKYQTAHEDATAPWGPAVPADAPVGDGSLGVLEGHGSVIDANGAQAYRYWLRTDVHGETAMAMALASRLLGDSK